MTKSEPKERISPAELIEQLLPLEPAVNQEKNDAYDFMQ